MVEVLKASRCEIAARVPGVLPDLAVAAGRRLTSAVGVERSLRRALSVSVGWRDDGSMTSRLVAPAAGRSRRAGP